MSVVPENETVFPVLAEEGPVMLPALLVGAVVSFVHEGGGCAHSGLPVTSDDLFR